jgi:hypothetical protein
LIVVHQPKVPQKTNDLFWGHLLTLLNHFGVVLL